MPAKRVYPIIGWTVHSSFILAAITLAAVFAGCSSLDTTPPPRAVQTERFAVYLLPAEYFFEGTVIRDCTTLGSELLRQEDIAAYNWTRHDIVLQPTAGERLAVQDLTGKLFVICVGAAEIYRGEFMAAYMSRSSDGVVILWPRMDGDTTHITIQLGYPGADFFVGADPRSDERIKGALNTAGVLQE